MPRRRLLIPLWLLLTAAAIWVGFLRAPLTTEMEAFLPPSEIDPRLLDAVRTGPASRTFILRLEGVSPAETSTIRERLKAQLLTGHHFEWVGHGGDIPFDDPLLFRYRYLLSPALNDAEHLSAPSLRRELLQRLEELTSPVGALGTQWLAADPSGEYRRVLAQLVVQANAPPMANPTGGDQPLFVRTRAAALDLDAQQAALTAVGEAVARVAPNVSWQAVGPGPFAVESRHIIRGETQLLTIASSLFVALLLGLGYRSWAPMWVAALPIATAIAVGAAATALVFGGLHGITVAFGATLIGVSLDYPVHLFSHQGAGRPLVQTARAIGRTLGLGAVTTVLGYFSLTLAGIAGMAQLGCFAATGLVAAALTTRFVLPGLLRPDWSAEPRLFLSPRLSTPFRAAVLSTAVLLTAAALLFGPAWQDDPGALSPLPQRLLNMERELRTSLGATEPGSALFVHGPAVQATLEHAETLRPRLEGLVADGSLSGFRLLSDLLPSARTQRARQATLPSDSDLTRALSAAAVDLPFQTERFAPFLADVEASRQLAPLTPEDLAGRPLAAPLSDLLQPYGDGWSVRIPLVGVNDTEAVRDAVADLENVTWVDLRDSVQRGTAQFRTGTYDALVLGSAAIAVALLLGLRSARKTVAVIAPVGLALGAVLGTFTLLGHPLTLFHLITLVLVAGIAIDYALFFLQHGRDDGAATDHAVLLSAVSTVAVFGILSTSEILVLQAVGSTAALGVAAALLLTLALARPEQRAVGSGAELRPHIE